MLVTDKPNFNLVKPPQQEVNHLTGIFINLETGCVWEIITESNKTKVNTPHLSFEIVPKSETAFKPVNPLINLEIEFENQTPFLLMHIYSKNIWKATFQEF